MSTSNPHPFERLSPDFIADAVETQGYVSDGRLLALNSYENRVYQVGIEASVPIIAKFYRPGRWTTASVLEEHAFALELAAAEIPVVAPLVSNGVSQGQSLHEYQGFHFVLYPRQGGRWPELGTRDDREQMGRFLARIHLFGRRQRFQHRAKLSVDTVALPARRFLLEQDWIPEHLLPAYESITTELIARMRQQWRDLDDVPQLRLHGDCHPGNVLWTDDGPHFVDLDDCLTGPAVQDLWMLLSGNRSEQVQQLDDILRGYTQFNDFDYRELALIETLRTLRLMNYAAWLARRWEDPAFPLAFPWFGDNKYWERHILDLREQLATLDEPPLSLAG